MYITIHFFIFSFRHLLFNRPDRLIITTTGKGRLSDTFEEKYRQRPTADLLVYFNATHLFLVHRYLYVFLI